MKIWLLASRKVGRPRTVTKRKRSRVSRFKTGVRRRASSVKKRIVKHKKSLSSTIIGIIPVVQSVQLLSENQVKGASGNEQKMKAVINGITGSTFDINLFDDAPKAHFNPSIEGAFNKWTITNAGLIIGGMVAQKFKLKHANKIKRVGTVALIPSLIAGILGKNNTEEKQTFNTTILTSHNLQTVNNGGVI